MKRIFHFCLQKQTLFFCIFFLSSFQVICQNFHQDSIKGHFYYKKADKAWKNIDTCYYYSKLALPLLKKTKQYEKYVYTLCGLNYCYNSREQYDSMEINNIFAFEEAQRFLLPENVEYNLALNNLALVYSEKKGDILTALKLYVQAYKNVENLNSAYDAKAPIQENIGDMYFQLGDFTTSIKYYKQAIESWKRINVDGKIVIPYIRLAKVYDKISRVLYGTQKFKDSRGYAEKGINTLKLSSEYDHNYMTRFMINLSKIGIALKDYDKPIIQLSNLQNSTKLTAIQKQLIFYNKGFALYKKSKTAEAIQQLQLGLQQKTNKDQQKGKAAIYNILAKINYSQSQYEKALNHQQSAVRLLVPKAILEKNLDTPNPSILVNSKLELFNTLIAKGKTLERLFETTQQLKYLEATFKTYQYVSHLTDNIRSLYQSDESQLLLLNQAKDFYEDAITTSYNLFEKKKDPKYLQQAFFFAEKSKSELLLEELRKKEFSGKGIIPDSLLTKQYEIKTAINYNRKLLNKESAKTEKDQSKIKNFENILFELQRDLSGWRDHIKKTYPTYSSITQQKPIELYNLQKKITSSQILLEYFVGDKNIFLFKITSDKVDLIKIRNAYNLDQFIETLYDHLKMTGEDGFENYSKIAHHLYKKLLPKEKIQLDKKDIIIIPDGPLENLSFDILLTSDSVGKSPRSLPYFIKKHATSYAYSATIYVNQINQQPIKNAAVAGVFPIFEGTEKELLFSPQVHQSLSKFSGSFLLKEEATVDSFLQIVEDFQVIHFSTHARQSDGVLQEPAIDFADSSLLLSDLQTYNLSASLAVLSACETNVGNYRKGEGIMSLSRGFAFAGVPSIITSTANVQEESTSTIMQSLYKYLDKGLSKNEALRQAKLDYLTSENISDANSAPYFWGTFLAIGNMDKITFQYPSQRKYWFGLLGILIIGCLLFFYKR